MGRLTRIGGKKFNGWKKRRREEARGRGDLASGPPPTLLAAEAQTVCSQRYMHLLALFQEIITRCVCVCVRKRWGVSAQPKVLNEWLQGGVRRNTREQRGASSVGVSDFGAKRRRTGYQNPAGSRFKASDRAARRRPRGDAH